MVKNILVLLLAAGLGLAAAWGYHAFGKNRAEESRNAASATVRSGDFATVLDSASAPLVLYSLEGCPTCAKAIDFLQSRGIAFESRDVGESSAFAAEAKAMGATQVPFIVLRRDSMEGFDEQKLLEMLEAHGLRI